MSNTIKSDTAHSGGDPSNPFQWTQTLPDVTIVMPLPEGTRGKMVQVDFQRRAIKAALKFQGKVLFQGDLFNDVVVDECTWSVEDQNKLVVTLEKADTQQWWPHVLTSDDKIDTKQIQPENSQLSDLDAETRAMVEKMMHDQKQEGAQENSEQSERQKILDQFKKQNPDLDFSQVEDKQWDD